MSWWKGLKGEFRPKELLKGYTTFKIGGPAKFFIEPKDIDDLKSLLNSLKKYKIKIFVMGAGSNILISDKGVNGAVLRLNSPHFKKICFNGKVLEVGSGALLSRLISSAQKYALSGVEFLAGIPGTVGGALVMNAGTSGKSIADRVENVTVMDYNGKIKTLHKEDIKFGYRASNLSEYIILGVCIKLIKGNRGEIKDRIRRYLKHRCLTQDLSFANAGCIFKNPRGYYAGKLIDSCGLKGRRIGNVCVSFKHANFILNLHKAKAKDVLKLMKLISKEVRNRFNISLEPEIKIWK